MFLCACVFVFACVCLTGGRRLLREESPGCEGVRGLPHCYDSIPDETIPGDTHALFKVLKFCSNRIADAVMEL